MGPNLYIPSARGSGWSELTPGFLFETELHVLWMNGDGTLGPLIKISGYQDSVWQLNPKRVPTPDPWSQHWNFSFQVDTLLSLKL